ncbi:MAG: hypothetical protein KatS3mg121_1320 [Gammaproteobacteria bacterium]|nr:MAG: hypothetical protein KatS3mg121_1320 [Gammaproteobacteria bacterium]
MNETLPLAAALLGLSGHAHCLAMCGGLATAPAAAVPPIWPRALAYHAGRFVAYGALGGAAGALGAGLETVLDGAAGGLRLAAAGLLVVLGVALLAGRRALPVLERPAALLWRALGPALQRARRWSAGGAPAAWLVLGVFWGLLPCGLVYAAAALAAGSGSPAAGMGVMLAFAVGTLPATLLPLWCGRILGRLGRGAGLFCVAAGLWTALGAWPGAQPDHPAGHAAHHHVPASAATKAAAEAPSAPR